MFPIAGMMTGLPSSLLSIISNIAVLGLKFAESKKSASTHPKFILRLELGSIRHLKRGPLTLLHGQFLTTYTVRNRIVEFSLKFTPAYMA